MYSAANQIPTHLGSARWVLQKFQITTQAIELTYTWQSWKKLLFYLILTIFTFKFSQYTVRVSNLYRALDKHKYTKQTKSEPKQITQLSQYDSTKM